MKVSNDIIELARDGDMNAFQQLVVFHQEMSFSLACSILKDEHLAEDALQEAFINVFKNIRKYQGKSDFNTWLYRIVVNTCYAIQRKQKLVYKEESNLGPELVFEGKDPEAMDRGIIINEALKRMKPDESLVLRLYYLSELNMEEIREVTQFSSPKIKTTLHRGRKSLEEILKTILGNELTHWL